MTRKFPWPALLLYLAVLTCAFAIPAADAAPGDFIREWGPPQHYKRPSGVTVDRSGKVYVSDLDRIQVFGADGKLIRRWGSYGSANGQFAFPLGIAVDTNGDIYVVDSENKRIQVFDSQGKFLRKWGSPGSGNGQFEAPTGIAIDASGNVMVTDYGHYDNALEMYAGRVAVFDHSGNFLRNLGSYGTGPTQIQAPSAIVTDKNGNIYIADSQMGTGNRIQVFSSSGAFLRSIAADATGNSWLNTLAVDGFGTVYVSYGDKDGYYAQVASYDSHGDFLNPVSQPYVDRWEEWYWYPYAIAVNGNNDIFFADLYNADLEAIDSAGNRLPQWWTYGTGDGQFNSPLGIAVDSSGNVHETDFGHAPSMVYSNRVQIFDGTGAFLRSWPGDDPGNRDPTALAVDKSGNTYVLMAEPLVYYGQDPGVQVYDPSGNLLRSWGSKGAGNGQFNNPRGIAVAPNGNVYLSDAGNSRIQVFDAAGTFSRAWGSEGSGDGQFSIPGGIGIDGKGNVYVADSGNYRVQVFDSSGNFLRKWGSQGTGAGKFAYLSAVAVDSSGHVYALDAGNNLVQVFDSNGTFLLQWGRQGDEAGAFDFYVNPLGPYFYNLRPYGLTVDAAGTTVYVADYDNNRIQEFEGFGSGTLPAPWVTRDIGSVGAVGQASFANEAFTLLGSGANIWGTVDAFRYVYQPLIGDGQIVARVTSVENTNGYAKGGVMIRESLNPDSRHAMVDMTPGYGAEFSRRLATGGSTSVNATSGVGFPEWVKLVRKADTFSAYISRDGVSWTSIGSATISMGSSVYVGLIDNSHLNSALCRVTMDNVTVTAQKQGPAVIITNPSDGSSFSAPATIVLAANASAGTGAGVKQVDFFAGNTLVGTATAAPYTATWSNVAAGNYSLTARVTDTLGLTATSPAVAITVTSSGLPAPWLSQDVGSVGVVGSASFLNGTFTVKGSGADIWGSSDAFRFVYQPITGDGQIIARVATLQNTNPYAKAAVMIRNSLAANAMHATMDLTPGIGAEFLRRTTTGGTTSATVRSGLAAPYWIRMVRTGNTFAGSVSSDGVNWTAIGSSTLSMSSTVYIGLAVNSHNNAVLCTANLDGVRITSAVDTTAPTVTAFTIPATSSSLIVPITTLTASDDTGVTGYLVNESSTKPSASASGWSATAPLTYTFSTTGTKTLYAWAKDAAGNVSNSRSATVTVSAGSLPSPWLTQDIGSVGVIGNASYANGTFTVQGSGADIYGSTDAFRYVYRTMTGNGQITARVISVQNTNTYAKGGLMIRESLTATSPYAMLDLTPPNSPSGAEFIVRPFAGTTGEHVTLTPGIAAPYWLKLVRVGSTISASISSDGVKWVTVGTTTVNMAATVYVGLISSSHNNSVLCTTTIDQVTLAAADVTPPTVTAFSVPATSSSLTVPVTLTATDDVAVTGYLVSESPDLLEGWTATPPTSYTFATAGSKTLYAWARDASGNVSARRSATTTVSGFPDSWQSRDIGSVGRAGTASYANGLFTLTGSGADIWSTVDAFQFVYKTMTGDGEIRARVNSLQNTSTWAKGGVMMRQSLTANSAHAMMDVTPGAGAEFSRRLTTGASTTVSSTAGIKAPYSVRLVRKGTTFTGYISPDGVNYVQVGSSTIAMTDTIYVGFIVNSHNNSVLCTTELSTR